MPVAKQLSSKDYAYFVTEDEMSSDKPTDDKPSKQEEAYNPETGEINWDCPCIAGMVEPPCGDKFKEAFSCFVYSKSEPKGSECIEQFREMQTCFQEHPEKYGSANEDEKEDEKDDEKVAATNNVEKETKK